MVSRVIKRKSNIPCRIDNATQTHAHFVAAGIIIPPRLGFGLPPKRGQTEMSKQKTCFKSSAHEYLLETHCKCLLLGCDIRGRGAAFLPLFGEDFSVV